MTYFEKSLEFHNQQHNFIDSIFDMKISVP